jgi:hypothetical protein
MDANAIWATIPRPQGQPIGMTRIGVAGFKSFVDIQSAEIKPLTLLASANSSGKTSSLQPLLLLKQTLDAPYHPGTLLLDGPNVKFASGEQFLSKVPGRESMEHFEVSIKLSNRLGNEDRLRIPTEERLQHRVRNCQHTRRAKLKDAHLVEAALQTGCPIISSDDAARRLFKELAKSVPRLRQIVWVNPTRPEERALEWLEEGAEPDPTRCLGTDRED